MKITTNCWHYRLYVVMETCFNAWMDIDEIPAGIISNTGLCQYMRMILIWGPLAILSNVMPLGAIAVTFWVLPGAAMGTTGVLWLLFWVAAIIIGIYIIGALISRRKIRKEAREERLRSQKYGGAEQTPPTGFGELMKEYARTMKTKICPIIEVDHDQS